MQIGDIRLRRIEDDDSAILFRFFDIDPLHCLTRVWDQRLDPLQPLRVDRSAVRVADLEAIVGGRVMRGCDIHSAAGFFIHNSKGDHGSGGGAIGEVDVQAIAHQHFSRGRRKILRVKAFVVSHYNPAPGVALLQ